MKMKNNIEEELVTFETAKLAKEKGFNIFTGKAWIKKEGQEIFFVPVYTGVTNGIDYHAPTQSLLQKWLREVHNIKLCISWTETDNWLYEINHKQEGISGYNTYEEALEKGLFQALKLIKNE